MNSLIQKIIANPRRIFLLDGIGALLSAFFLGIVLMAFHEYFGVSTELLMYLAIAAVVFAIYSFSCYFVFPDQWRSFFKVIAIVNLIYCLVTIWFVLLESETLTTLGYLYFIGEVLLILSLVFVEFKVARS